MTGNNTIYIDPELLVPYAKNSKIHSDDVIKELADSMAAIGFNRPVSVDENNMILAGHKSVKAAIYNKNNGIDGFDKIPVFVASGLTDAQRKAFILAENRHNEKSEWDFDLVSQELDALKMDDFDIELTGFDDGFILDEPEEGLTDEDAVPDAPDEPVTVLGDVWVMGEHRLICGDATMIDDWDKLDIPDGFVVVSSPPYNLGDNSGIREKYERGKSKDLKTYNEYADNSSADEYMELLNTTMTNGLIYCDCVAYNLQMLKGCKEPLLDWMADNSKRIIDIITWDKKSSAPHIQAGVMSSRFEWIFLISKEENATKVVPHSSWQGKHSNIFTQTTGKNNYADKHKAVFPVELPAFIGGDLMNRCRGLVDCFSGTGTTIIAAEKLGKGGRGIELDPTYVDISVIRWQEFTGKTATLENDGRTFDEIKAERLGGVESTA